MSEHISIHRTDVEDLRTLPPRIKLYLRILAGAIMLGDTEILLVFLCEFEPTTRLFIAATTYVLHLLLTLTLRIKITSVKSDPRVPDIDYFSIPFIFSWVPLGILAYLVNERFIGASSLLSVGLLSLVVLAMHTLLFTWLVGIGMRLFVRSGWHTCSSSFVFYKSVMVHLEIVPLRRWQLGMPLPVLSDPAARFV